MENINETKVARKTLVGIVSSSKMDKTIVVQATGSKKHKRLGKIMKTKFRVSAHDEKNEAAEGDRVLVKEVTRPLSKTKRWILKEIVEKTQ